jgi:DNA-binding response OmpR family regulator
MKLLIADDDAFFRELLQRLLAPSHELVVVADGHEAWATLQGPDAPRLAILDWVMPGLSGPQVCRRARTSGTPASSAYLIILTAKNNEADIVSGLRAGADDYLTKPPIPAELRARVKVGERILALQDAVEAQVYLANQGTFREHLSHESPAGCPARQARTGEEIIKPCSQLHCAPEDCCSISVRKPIT